MADRYRDGGRNFEPGRPRVGTGARTHAGGMGDPGGGGIRPISGAKCAEVVHGARGRGARRAAACRAGRRLWSHSSHPRNRRHRTSTGGPAGKLAICSAPVETRHRGLAHLCGPDPRRRPNWPLRLVSLTQSEVITAIRRWQSEGRSVSEVSGRWLVLRSAISWAVAEGILRSNPLAGMRGPARPQPRRHHTLAEVRQNPHRC